MNYRASKISHPPSQLWLHHQDEETLLEPGENARPAPGSSGVLGSSIGRCWNASCILSHVTLNDLFSFALKAKCSDTRVKCHVTLVLVGPMNPKGRLWDGGANAWPASFSGERCALCLRCVIDSTAVVMIYPLRISCYASVANKQAMTFILLASSPLVCSGNTFEFSQRASFSVSLFFFSFKVVKIQSLSLIMDIPTRTRRGFPPKWEMCSIQGSKRCLLARGEAVHCEDMKVVSHFGAVGSPKPGEVWTKLRFFFSPFFTREISPDKCEVPAGSSEGTRRVLLRWSLLRCLI